MAWKLGYELPKEVYMQTLWFIRTYPQMKEEYTDLIEKAHVMDGQPRGTDIGDPTGQMAVKRAELAAKIKAVENAMTEIPGEYRMTILDSIVFRTPYKDYANIKTWKNWRRRFVFFVAKYMGFY